MRTSCPTPPLPAPPLSLAPDLTPLTSLFLFLPFSFHHSQDHAKKCSQCLDIIFSAKERQAAEANKNASILLQELDLEKVWEGVGQEVGGGGGTGGWVRVGRGWDRRLGEGVGQEVG